MISFKLNGKTVQGEEGQYILQVAAHVQHQQAAGLGYNLFSLIGIA